MQFDDKVVLVTGAGSNVGSALIRLTQGQGARLALVDLDPDRVLSQLQVGAGQAFAVAADLTRAAECERAVRETLQRFGRIDVLCNTVGIDLPSATVLHETSEDDWSRIMAVNLTSVFLMSKYVLPVMMAQRAGAIVNVASQGAIRALPRMAAYGVSKAGVLQLTRQIAVDYAAFGIRANCVCPSGLELPSRDRLLAMDDQQLERRANVMREAVPLGRLCTPEDVAQAMLFLASDAAAFITGAALAVDGGTTVAIRL